MKDITSSFITYLESKNTQESAAILKWSNKNKITLTLYNNKVIVSGSIWSEMPKYVYKGIVKYLKSIHTEASIIDANAYRIIKYKDNNETDIMSIRAISDYSYYVRTKGYPQIIVKDKASINDIIQRLINRNRV